MLQTLSRIMAVISRYFEYGEILCRYSPYIMNPVTKYVRYCMILCRYIPYLYQGSCMEINVKMSFGNQK